MERRKSFRDYGEKKTWTIKLGILNKTSSKKSREKDTLKKTKSPNIKNKNKEENIDGYHKIYWTRANEK